jgi:hypothetical protein
MLWQSVSRPVCLEIKHPSGSYNQIFITVRQLRVCWCGALSLTRGWVCHLQFLLALTSAIILGSESHGTCGHILLSQIWESPFVASYDSQAYTGGIRPHIHTGFLWFLYSSTLISFILTVKQTPGSTVLLLRCTELLPWIPYYWVVE